MKLYKGIIIMLAILPLWGSGSYVLAHPMPNSMVILNVHQNHISGQIQLPLNELQSAIGRAVNDNPDRLIERLGDTLRAYLKNHIRPKSFEGKLWNVEIGEMKVVNTKNTLTGDYNELDVEFKITPPQNYDLRNFYFDYDVILHQVASHRALINIKQDWQQGIVKEDSTMQQIGVIEWDVVNNKLPVFQVSLQAGSNVQGFQSMVSLGISHIKEGIDHIFFVITLLLAVAAPVVGSSRRKLFRLRIGDLIQIVTSFTIGHSLTLIFGTNHWLNFPVKSIEILIAITILISAFHAFKSIYPKKEIFVAGGFGLIHGLAFSQTLKSLELSTSQMVFSVLGFNIGIELLQIVIILIIFPILIFISQTKYYPIFRKIGAVSIMIMAAFWLFGRI